MVEDNFDPEQQQDSFGNVKVYNFQDNGIPTQVIVHVEFDVDADEFAMVLITYYNGRTLTSYNSYPSMSLLMHDYQSYTIEDARKFYETSSRNGVAAPHNNNSLLHLKELDFDSFCEWAEEQDPRDIPGYRSMMLEQGMTAQASALNFFVKKHAQ